MKILILLFCISAYADSSKLKTKAEASEIRDVVKRNSQFQKLAADARIAAAKRDAFMKTWSQECQAKGMELNIVPGDGRLDCVAKPVPPPKETPK